MGAALLLGLFFLFLGAFLVDLSNTQVQNESPEATDARLNLGLVWGPALAHFGMFLFVLGLIAAAVFVEEMDVFVRLFLVILAFVALLLVLTGSSSVFGVP